MTDPEVKAERLFSGYAGGPASMVRSDEASAVGGKSRGTDELGQEPTVFGAVRRHWPMVVVVTLITMAVAVGYTLVVPELYRARGSVTVPLPVSTPSEEADQYLDSQVLLLRSREVAEQATRIANDGLRDDVFVVDDFIGDRSSFEITPPEGANPGSFGSTTVAVAFTWPDARAAQVGANSALQAFNEVRSAAILADAEARAAGIERAIRDPRTRQQYGALENQRTEALVAGQVDLARQPTVAWAGTPEVPVNANSRNAAIIGLVLGLVLGAALAYVWAVRRKRFDDRAGPGALYGAPLIGEVPALDIGKAQPDGSAPVGVPVMVRGEPRVAGQAVKFAAGTLERIRATRARAQVLAVVSPRPNPGRSVLVADLALALAAGGTRVLVVDAGADGVLTGLLLPGDDPADGWAQLVAGQGAAVDRLRPSPWNEAVTVLGAGPSTAPSITGAAYAKAAKSLLAEVAEGFDVVLVDSPPVLEVAEAGELAGACDGIVVVVGEQDLVRDHVDVVDRLHLIDPEVLGYVFHRTAKQSPLASVRTVVGRLAPGRPSADGDQDAQSAVHEDPRRRTGGGAASFPVPQPRR
ncbi:Wzz/FepE/Etk N-terminal domain-containing protein [Pseudonocardia sp. RS010]|uniref:Wzz/FepE/Etk N-terminal domain-containing protein n=1 Tax=Pseudonocardia sp. RS010 TaxID=3385979 RepID=UPI0039A1A90E